MELKIVNANAEELYEAYGISPERANELGESMNVLMILAQEESWAYAQLQQAIAAICNTNEEFASCITNNYNWLVANRVIKIKGVTV